VLPLSLHPGRRRRLLSTLALLVLTGALIAPARAAAPPRAPLPIGVASRCTFPKTNGQRVAILDRLQAAGVRWARLDVDWVWLEKDRKGDRQRWYLRMLDFCVRQAQAHHTKVLATLLGTPRWANGGRDMSVPPIDARDYGQIASWLAHRYRGRIAAWQIWNEPNPSQHFFTGTVEQYVALLRSAYPAIKRSDHHARVVLGGTSGNDDRWLEQVYDAGGGRFFDVVATHPYQGVGDSPPETADDGNVWWLSHTPAVRAVMLAHGDARKPIWFTELGWSAHDNTPSTKPWDRGVTPEQQASYATRAFAFITANYPYVKLAFWFKDWAVPGSTDAAIEGMAVLNPDMSPRPVYEAIKAYTRH
jgi:polysaccharide biosynthesis protein PslG